MERAGSFPDRQFGTVVLYRYYSDYIGNELTAYLFQEDDMVVVTLLGDDWPQVLNAQSSFVELVRSLRFDQQRLGNAGVLRPEQ